MGRLVIGILSAQALFLAAAGFAKLSRPAETSRALRGARLPAALTSGLVVRTAALAEIAVAAGVVIGGGRVAAALFAVTFGALAVVAARIAITQPGADCGCFGAVHAPAGHWHTAVNGLCAVTGLTAVVIDPPSLAAELTRQPLFGIPLAAAVVLLAWLLYICVTALPELWQARAELAGPR